MNNENMKDSQETKNQKKAILMLEGVIVLLLVVIIFLLVVPKINKSQEDLKEHNTQEETSNKEEKVTEDIQAVITEKAKKVSKHLSTFFPFNSVSEISNQELLRFAEKNIPNAMNGFSSSDLNSYLKNYFGNNVQIKHENITCDMVAVGDKNHPYLFLYDGNGKYSYNQEHHGHGACSISPNLKSISSVKRGNEIVASYRILYTICCDTCGPVSEYYIKLPNSSNNLALKVEEGKTPTVDEMNAAYEKAPITQFTFEADSNGNYFLKSVTEK